MELDVLLVRIVTIIIYIVPIIATIKKTMKIGKIRLSRILIIGILINELILGLQAMDVERLLKIGIETIFSVTLILVVAHIPKAIKDKKEQEVSNMHLFDDMEDE